METRKITIANSRDQRKHVIMSAATTLGELKRDLDEAGIIYAEMDFIEALSKTQLRGDNSVLPHDVPYKHTTTNELVFLLTVPNRKIKSGIGREDIYNRINNHSNSAALKEAIKEHFGRNYTMVTTTDLEIFLNDWEYLQDLDEAGEDVPEKDRIAALEKKIDNLYEALMETIDVLDIDYDTTGIYSALTNGVEVKDTTVYSANMTADDIDELINDLD